MTRNVVALYDNFEDANAAVRDLVDQGFQREDISFMAADQSRMTAQYGYRDRLMHGADETSTVRRR
jgi:hypothetical protein